MEHNTVDLSDPITAKLRDSAMLARLVKQAVAEAVDKARRLGFLDQPVSEVTVDEMTLQQGGIDKTR